MGIHVLERNEDTSKFEMKFHGSCFEYLDWLSPGLAKAFIEMLCCPSESYQVMFLPDGV